jgi:DNA polymerase V
VNARVVEILDLASSQTELCSFSTPVSAGFPSPAEDFVEGRISLDRALIPHPTSTFLLRVAGDSMLGAGIHHGDRLVVDRAVEPTDGRVVVAVVGGEFLVKRLRRRLGNVWLEADPRSDVYPDLEIRDGGLELVIWGVVTCVLHEV